MNGTGRGSLRASAANVAGVRCPETIASSDMASGKDASRNTAFKSGDAPAARQKESVGPRVGRDRHHHSGRFDQKSECRNDVIDGQRREPQTGSLDRTPRLQ